jgi:DNA polymerase-1
MTNPFAAIASAAGAAAPMSSGTYNTGRTLYIDGDGLAYYCAGNDDATTEAARDTLHSFIRQAKDRAGAEFVRVLVTSSGSSKGDRFAIARAKPYQGQRADARRPKNWQYLRLLLEASEVAGATTEHTAIAEADDLFGYYGHKDPEHSVILTQDKDMRMVPGWHMGWVNKLMHYVPADTYERQHDEKVFGLKWFWLQMLQGDTADNIPGLPKYQTLNAKGESALKPVGEKTAEALLADAYCNADCRRIVEQLYQGYYPSDWLTQMLEQACLLWMRRKPENWFDVVDTAGPLAEYNYNVHRDELEKALGIISERIKYADSINAAATQDH